MEWEKSIYLLTAEAKASATKLSFSVPEQTTTRLGKEDRLSHALSQFIEKFLVMAQQYPAIPDPAVKDRTATMESLQRLSITLQDLEQEILMGRKGLNDAVRVYNQNLAIFPANVFAARWGFQPLQNFHVLNEQASQDATLQF